MVSVCEDKILLDPGEDQRVHSENYPILLYSRTETEASVEKNDMAMVAMVAMVAVAVEVAMVV
jgi:hypothetical protein